MSQIFHRSSNIYSRLSILAVVGIAAIAGRRRRHAPPVRIQHEPGRVRRAAHPVQPRTSRRRRGVRLPLLPYHVEESAFANIPPTKTCMNCHSQIWTNAPILEPVRASFRDNKPLHWTRVHDLPDFVYFNHSIHVSKGVGCATCHGRGRPDAAHVSAGERCRCRGASIATGIPAKLRPAARSGLQHGVGAAGRRSRPRRTAGARNTRSRARQLTSCSTCHR